MGIGVLFHVLPNLFLKVFNIVVGRITQNISVRFRIVIPYKLIYSNGAPDNNEDEICLFTVKPGLAYAAMLYALPSPIS